MDRPKLEIIEKNSTSVAPVLVFDQQGLVGHMLAEKLKDYCFIVFVTSLDRNYENKNILKVSYKEKLKIPETSYSHIFFVTGGKEDKKVLKQFAREAHKLEAKLVLITQINNKNFKDLEKQILEYRKEAITIVLGDLFSAEMPTGGHTDSLLEEAKFYKQLYVSSMGMDIVHPVLLEDAIDAVFEISLGRITAGKPYLVYPKQGIAVLSIIHILQKIDPLIRVDFKEGNNGKDLEQEFKGDYYFPVDYPLIEKLKNAYFQKTSSVSEKLRKFLKPQVTRKPIAFIHLAVSSALLIFLLPIFLSLVLALAGFVNLGFSLRLASQMQPKTLANQALVSGFLFRASKNFFNIVVSEGSYVGLSNQTSYLDSLIQSGEYASSFVASGGKAAGLYEDILQGKSKSPKEDSVTAWEELKKTLYLYNILSTSMLSDSFKKYKDVADYASSVVSGSVDTIPTILGAEGKRTYLILFQNNMELRPGGGFIGSYGILNLDHGRISDFSVHDVYDADGKLKGHVEPPFPIRRYIPMVHWYLRDSNFDIDYLQNAKNSAFFLKEETGEDVDGVFAVDTTAIKYLIEALGNVSVPDYGETVNTSNFYLLTEKHAEKDFFPGSTQKKDFLRSLSLAIKEKISNKNNFSMLKIVGVLQKSLQEKHLLVAFSNESIQGAFSAGGLSSSIIQQVLSEKNVSDFLGVNEANLGVNKANYFLQRRIADDISIDKDGSISGKVKIAYYNGSEGWPGGDYKVYIRVILPLDASISEIDIDGQKKNIVPAVTDFSVYENKSFIAPDGLEINQYEEDSKEIFGFLTTVVSQKNQIIEISYNLSAKLPKETSFYNLYLFKQPGLDYFPFDLSVNIDPSFSIFLKPQNSKIQEGKLTQSQTVNGDSSFRIGIAPK